MLLTRVPPHAVGRRDSDSVHTPSRQQTMARESYGLPEPEIGDFRPEAAYEGDIFDNAPLTSSCTSGLTRTFVAQ
jgi:hypothetical protein